MGEVNSESETYSVMFKALKHPIRRRILNMIGEKPTSFSEILKALQIDSGHLTYHLDSLGELVSKNDHGEYQLSVFGRAAVKLFSDVEGVQEATSSQGLGFFDWRHWTKLKAITLVVIIIVGLASAVYFSNALSQKPVETPESYKPYTDYEFESPNFVVFDRFTTVAEIDVLDPRQSNTLQEISWSQSFEKGYNGTVFFHIFIYGEDLGTFHGFQRAFDVGIGPSLGWGHFEIGNVPYWEDVVRLDGDGPCTLALRLTGPIVEGERNAVRTYIQVDKMIVVESVTLSVNATKIGLGESIRLSGHVYPTPYIEGGHVEVMIRYDRGGQGGWEIPGRGKGIPVNPDGSFSIVWTPRKNGLYTFKASFSSWELTPATSDQSGGSPYPPFTIYSNTVVIEVEGGSADSDYGVPD